MEYIKTKKDLKDFIAYEEQLYEAKHASLFGPVYSEKQYIWRYISLLRYQEYHTNRGHRFLSLFYKYRRIKMGRKCGFNIPINVIDKGFLMFHIGNVLINAEKIGKNFDCGPNVACIAGGHDGGHPTVGDNVALGYGATLCGNITIANGIAVGACSFVNKTFLEENICIAGSPAKKISDNGSTTWGGCKIFQEIKNRKS